MIYVLIYFIIPIILVVLMSKLLPKKYLSYVFGVYCSKEKDVISCIKEDFKTTNSDGTPIFLGFIMFFFFWPVFVLMALLASIGFLFVLLARRQ